MRALLAEDNDINALVAQKALRRLGFEVERARDGEEASRLALAASRGATPRFDVVLMDIKMPGVDGLEAVRRIRRAEAEAKAPPAAIVALTASATIEDADAATAAGFDAFLAKPVEVGRLEATIEGVLEGRGSAPARAHLS
jgi:CheY-like chemotaxis protein